MFQLLLKDVRGSQDAGFCIIFCMISWTDQYRLIYTAVRSWSHWVVRAASHCPSWQRWLFDALWDTHMVMITLVHVIFLFGLARTKIMLSSKCYCGAFSAISWISNFCCRLTIQNEPKRRSTTCQQPLAYRTTLLQMIPKCLHTMTSRR